MADALSGLTEVASNIETIVSLQVQEVLNANVVMPSTVMDLSSQVGPGMDTLKIPNFGKFTVGTKAENVAADAQTNAFSSTSLSLNRHKYVQWLVEDIASLQSKIAVSQYYVQQASIDLANEMDQFILDTLEAGPSAAAPDHKIAYVGATIAKADILAARAALNLQNVPMSDRFMSITPAEEAALLAIAEFTQVNTSGDPNAFRNGELGRIFGFTVLLNTKGEDAKSMFWHKNSMCFARQLAPRIKTFDDVPNLGMRYSIDHIYGGVVLQSKAIYLAGTA
jgi:hypothetical protein